MKSRSGFTLLELLVVVGIIALLIAMLVPKLAEARATARLMVCASNLKGLAQWGLGYAQDNDNVLPMTGGNNGYSWATSSTWCWNYAGDSGFTGSLLIQSSLDAPWNSRYYFKGLNCPEARIFVPFLHGQNCQTYGLNAYLGGYKGILTAYGLLPADPTYVPKANLLTSEKWWFSDGHASQGWSSFYFIDWNNIHPVGYQSPWMFATTRVAALAGAVVGHPNQSSNFSFGDAHVERLTQGDVLQRLNAANSDVRFNGTPFE